MIYDWGDWVGALNVLLLCSNSEHVVDAINILENDLPEGNGV